MIAKMIMFCGKLVVVACDGECHKAWGTENRPKLQRTANNPDDWEWLADGELGLAPANPGTSEGGHLKPSGERLDDARLMNRWCARQCERATLTATGELFHVRSFEGRVPNRNGSTQGDLHARQQLARLQKEPPR